MSAYACEPGRGSEPGAGWAWARAAAASHEVWLLTRANNRPAIEAALADEAGLAINPIYIDLPGWARWWKRGPRGARVYYVLWQSLARREARRAHAAARFDVAHHVTFATDWAPAGVVGIPGLPSIWGPVGGAAPFPWTMRRWLGGRGLAAEVGRAVGGAAGRRLFGDRAARRACVVVVQNREVARRFSGSDPVIEPNVAVPLHHEFGGHDAPRVPSGRHALFVGRLVRWKGLRLAIATLAEPPGREWSLRVLGAGPDRVGADTFARRLGVADRVSFAGAVARGDVEAELRRADVFLFPSMHDSAAWAVAEAIAAGLPVVCLDVGGPAVLIERTGGGIAVAPSQHAAARLAEALARASAPRWPAALSPDRLPALLDDWYTRATGAMASTRPVQTSPGGFGEPAT